MLAQTRNAGKGLRWSERSFATVGIAGAPRSVDSGRGAAFLLGALAGTAAAQRNAKDQKDAQKDAQKDPAKSEDSKRPKLTLKAQPLISITPARVVLTAELVGGALKSHGDTGLSE